MTAELRPRRERLISVENDFHRDREYPEARRAATDLLMFEALRNLQHADLIAPT